MENLKRALIAHLGFFRYIGYEFTDEENGFCLTLRPSAEEEWQTDAVTEIHVSADGYYTEMTFFVDKNDTDAGEMFLYVNRYNEGPSPVKLFLAEDDADYAIVGTMPNIAAMDPDFHLSPDMSDAKAEALAAAIGDSVLYLRGYVNTVISDFTGDGEA